MTNDLKVGGRKLSEWIVSLEEYVGPETQGRRLLQYILVGLVGIAINESVLFLTTGVLGVSYVVGGFLGRVISIFTNYLMNDTWTWGSRGAAGLSQWLWRGFKYVVTRIVGIGIGLVSLVLLVELLGIHYLIANLIAIGVGVLWGFGASDRWVWPSQSTRSSHPMNRRNLDHYLPASINHRFSDLDSQTWYVLTVAMVMFVVLSVYTSALYHGFWLTGSDFGSYVHMFSTTLSGEGFLLHGKYRVSHPAGTYWGAHFTLTLFLFMPFYALFPSPITLLILKSLVLSGSIPVLWIIARSHIDSDRIAGLVVASYTLNPFLWSAWIFDFQEQALLPILIFAAYYWYHRQDYRLFLVAFTLGLLTNEFAIVILAGGLAGLAVVAHRSGRLYRERYVLGGAALSAVIVKLIAGIVTASFSQFAGIPMTAIADPIRPLMDGPRIGMAELIILAVSNPVVLTETFAIDSTLKVLYFVALLVPVLFLALYDEITLGALIPFIGFAWLLSGRPIYYQFGAHYPFYLLPFIYIGAVRTLGIYFSGSSMVSWRPIQRLLTQLFVLILVLNLIAGVSIGVERHAVPQFDDHTRTLNDAIESVPAEASLITQNDIYPHVAARPAATYLVRPDMFQQYQQRYGPVTPEYVLFDTGLDARPVDWSNSITTAFQGRLGDEYGLLRYEDGIYLYQRGYQGSPIGFTGEFAVDREYDARDLKVASGRISERDIVSSTTGTPQSLWFGPYDDLPPGVYAATFRLNVSGTETVPSGAPIVRLSVADQSGGRTLAEKSVGSTAGWTNETLTFTLRDRTTDIEFRGAGADGTGNITLDSIRVRNIRDVDVHIMGDDLQVTEGSREQGRIIGESPGGQRNIWFGPFMDLPPGRYTVTYRVRVVSNDPVPVVMVNAAKDDGATLLAAKPVSSTDGWEEITLTFELTEPTADVEFRGARAGGRGTVILDSIRVTRQNSTSTQ